MTRGERDVGVRSNEPLSYVRTALMLIAFALIAVGPMTVLAPATAATAFGIPAATAEARAYLLASATRDVALGIWLLALVRLRAGRRLLASSVFAIALVAAGDATNVAAYMGWQPAPALVLHIGGVFVLLMLGLYLWRGESE